MRWMVCWVLAGVGCLGAAPSSAPGSRQPGPIAAAVDAGAPAAPDAEPVTALDVFHAAARTASTVYWRVPGQASCQPWRFEPGESWGRHGRLVGPDGARIGFDYAVEGDEIVLDTTLEGGCAMSERCAQRLRPESDDDLGIVLGGGRWYYDRAECEAGADAMPAGCAAMLLGLPARSARAADPIAAAIKKRRALHLLAASTDGYACGAWRVEPERLYQTEGDWTTEYGLDHDGATITLSGPSTNNDRTGEGMALGCFEQHPVERLTDEIALVGGWPWFATAAACDQARARTQNAAPSDTIPPR